MRTPFYRSGAMRISSLMPRKWRKRAAGPGGLKTTIVYEIGDGLDFAPVSMAARSCTRREEPNECRALVLFTLLRLLPS